MKKIMMIIGIMIASLVGLIVLFFGSVYVIDKVSLKKESQKIVDYGEKVSVAGQKINVTIIGEGKETIVLLPGFMTPAPVIDFTQLTAELKNDYRVVLVEPFGYGLSDDTSRERSIENITTELHDALEQLEISQYTLMGHSIFGIYSLEYINKYRDEVTRFIGLDSSVPAQGGAEDTQSASVKVLKDFGIYRLLAKISPETIITPPLSAELVEQNRLLALKNIGTEATLNEAVSMSANFEKADKLTYPVDLPVQFILASESLTDTPGWLELHQDIVKDVKQTKIDVLEGGHYLHHTQAPKIAELITEFSTTK